MVVKDVSAGHERNLQTIVESDSSETIKFYWKVSGQSGYDYLKFYIDDDYQGQITDGDWDDAEFTVPSGIHTLRWVYSEGGSSGGKGWVDYVQWSGPSPQQDPNEWQNIEYKYDLYGRRIEKKVDGFSTRYVYACGEPAESNGDQVIAEYDGNNNLLRKYIYGPGIDQPVCMIEEAESETYYYHYDGLGSVVALSDSSGDTVQTYEYSVFGQPVASDVDFPNPYMFAGRRYDIEIGLYYNRARYYNPYTGRFLQTDPVGYKVGMNLYAYCGDNPLNRADPSGLYMIEVTIPLEVIWHRSSVGASIGDRIVKEGPDPQHKSDVKGFLDESNFFDDFNDVTLKYVIYSGDETTGSYLCGFEVPDKYDDMRMDIEPQTGGFEVLVVTTGHWYTGNKREVKIWDWRLLGMVGENLARAQVDSVSRYWADAWIEGIVTTIAGGVLVKAPSTWPVSAPIFGIFMGLTVFDVYKLSTSPTSFPNYIYTENYLEYIENAGGYDEVTSRYEDYKRKRGEET